MSEINLLEDTSSKIIVNKIFSYRPDWTEWTDQNLYPNIRWAIGTAVVIMVLVIGYDRGNIGFWFFWISLVLSSILEISLLVSIISSKSRYGKIVKEEIATINFDTGRATRIKELLSGKIEKKEIELDLVDKILIQFAEHWGATSLIFELPGKPSFLICSHVARSGDKVSFSIVELGNRLGRLINRPVIRQETD